MGYRCLIFLLYIDIMTDVIKVTSKGQITIPIEIRKKLQIEKESYIVVDMIGDYIIMKKVGLKLIGVGFESGSDRVLKFLRKGSTRKMNVRAAQIIKDNSVLLSASFMLGIPEEDEQDVLGNVYDTKIYSRMLKYVGPVKNWMIIGAIGMLLRTFAQLATPYIIAIATVDFIQTHLWVAQGLSGFVG